MVYPGQACLGHPGLPPASRPSRLRALHAHLPTDDPNDRDGAARHCAGGAGRADALDPAGAAHRLAVEAGRIVYCAREAVAELQSRGLLATRAGAGIYVADVLGSAFSPALIRLFAAHQEAVFDYIAFRRDIESLAAERAARHGSDTDLAVVDTIFRKMEAAHSKRNPSEEAGLDAEFHMAIIEASHKPVYSIVKAKSPPRLIIDLAKCELRDIPPLSISPPASMNRSTAIIGHESRAVNILCGTNAKGRVVSINRALRAPRPNAKCLSLCDWPNGCHSSFQDHKYTAIRRYSPPHPSPLPHT